ncbi:MAG: cupin domain-containing protein [Ahrensia sp.]|nr:cupin domain-containing protein [Ahrensia sp.]
MQGVTAASLIETLKLQRHPEGGHYVETFRDEAGASTAIYYLLEAGDCSAWHRVHGSAEVWHFYAGAPLALTLSPNDHDAQAFRLGANVAMGEKPQVVVPAGCWQTAESLGSWTLVGCTVAPAFDFSNFEMAPDDWRPTPRSTS